jgi:membrane protein implicated in regulation of membrane protease activity
VSGGQIAALIFAILLLLPGGCFLFFGIILTPGTAVADPVLLLLPIAAAILALAGLLFWVAFRRRRPGPGATPGSPPS